MSTPQLQRLHAHCQRLRLYRVAAELTTLLEQAAKREVGYADFLDLDVLVNNAGTAIPKPFEEATLEELDRVIDVNVRGTLVATQAALKHMRDGGRIIMIGSSVGERNMMPGLVPYAATKGAVKMFTQGLSREVGSRGITVQRHRARYRPSLMVPGPTLEHWGGLFSFWSMIAPAAS